MTYVAAKGGEAAIQQAEALHGSLLGPLTAERVDQVERHLPYLVDRVMGEASVYAPRLAALAIAQTGGDLYEATLILRAYRSTQPRLAYAVPLDAGAMTVVRRISAAFREIPGGQVLGPSLDYSHRLLRLDILDGTPADPDAPALRPADAPAGGTFPAVADWQRGQGLIGPTTAERPAEDVVEADGDPARIPDLTREPFQFPAPRSHRLQALARSDTGGALALAYAQMRGYGAVHPTVNELRLAFGEVRLRHPITGVVFSAGRVRVSQAEIVTPISSGGDHRLELGFCGTLGWNEVKTISGAILDAGMDRPGAGLAAEESFVLQHTEPIEGSGFCVHYKLPHYVTFQSELDALRSVRAARRSGVEVSPNGQGVER